MALVSGSSPTSGEVSAIETALSAFVLVNPQTGVRTVDRNALREWLRDEIDAQYSWTCGADAGTVKAAYDGYLWGQLETFIDKFVTAYESVKTSGGATFPSITTDKSANAAAVSQLQAEAKVQAAVIENHTMDAIARIESGLETTLRTKLAERYPEVVERNIESRIYAVTFVTDWGEESAPSPVTDLLEVDQNDTVTVALPTVPSGRNINRWRIYRSATGSMSTALLFVVELPIATTSYVDEIDGDALGEPCPSLSWLPPPAGLKGLVGMPNGIMAGFAERTVYFCEPYTPYAWPAEYYLPIEHLIVGLGVFGQTLFVGTHANPYVISGADSASMSAIKLEWNQACVSKRSIVTVGGGVAYASPDGLCFVSDSGLRVLTEAKFDRAAWQALNPSSILGAEHEGVYYCFYDNGTKGCYTIDAMSGEIGTLDIQASAVWVDKLTDMLYFANGSTISQAFGGAGARTGVWRSKLFRLPQHASFAWVKAAGEIDSSVTVTLYKDGESTPFYVATITGTSPVRLPTGRYEDWQIQVESTSRLVSLIVASDTASLQGVPI